MNLIQKARHMMDHIEEKSTWKDNRLGEMMMNKSEVRSSYTNNKMFSF